MKVPKRFKVFASTIEVQYDNDRLSYEGSLGEASFNQFNNICLVDKYKGVPLDSSVVLDSFYHERLHIILHAMGEHELSRNEKFVEVFARLLRQSDETAEFE